MNTLKTILYFTLLVGVGLLIGAGLASWEQKPEPVQEESREVFYDTIPIYFPVLRDSVVVRYETATLPLAEPIAAPDSATVQDSGTAPDSARVLVPISSVCYEDSTFRAYVSGFHPSLDSIFVFPRREVITIGPKPKRWAVGLTAGYAFTPRGFQPYFGAGITCKLFEF